MNSIEKQILAILFASGDAIETERIAQALRVDIDMVSQSVASIQDHLKKAQMPFVLLQLEKHLQLCTEAIYADCIREALEVRRNAPLSQAALEVLSIIAYNQPTTRAFIEQVRGVDSSGIVNTLVKKQLIEECGRLELPGRPISYQTTPQFLRCFGLTCLEDLPKIPTGKDAELYLSDCVCEQIELKDI